MDLCDSYGSLIRICNRIIVVQEVGIFSLDLWNRKLLTASTLECERKIDKHWRHEISSGSV